MPFRIRLLAPSAFVAAIGSTSAAQGQIASPSAKGQVESGSPAVTAPLTDAPQAPHTTAENRNQAAPVTAASADQAQPEVARDIVVTGSRIARVGFDAPTPVAVVGAEDIKLSGQVNPERALQELPQVFSGAGAFSNNVSGNGGGFADINLRGLGSNRNLVLVNGRRYAIFSGAQITDINTIPASLIQRTEVVTGGSSAVYGSDAITGVVNFILEDDFDGVSGRGQVNLVPHTSTPTYNLDLTMGKNFADGRGNVTLALNYLDRQQANYGEYDWSNFAFARSEGCVVPRTGSRTSPGTPFAIPSGQTCTASGGSLGYVFTGSNDIPNGRVFGIPAFGGSNAALNTAYAAADLTGLTTNGFTFNDGGTATRIYEPTVDSYNNTPPNSLQSPQERYMANAFAHFDVSKALTFFTELHYSHNKVQGTIAAANYNAPYLVDVNNPYLSPAIQNVLHVLDASETGTRTVTHGSTNFTTVPNDGLAVVSIGRRFGEFQERRSLNTRDLYRGAFGARGDLGDVSSSFLTGLKYEAYYTYSKASEDIFVSDGVSKSKLQQSILSVNGAAPLCNQFGQNLSPDCLQAISADGLSHNQADLQVAQGNITGTLVAMPAGPAGFSLGVEWRKTSAEFTPSANLATGDIAGYNASLPTKGSVNVKEVFGEVSVPLIHNAFLIDSLTLNAGFRGSDYSLSGVGTVWTYFGGADWSPFSGLTFRGQYQRAIRAPSVGELYAGQATSSLGGNDPCSNRVASNLQTETVRALCVATGVPAGAVFSASVQPAAFIYGAVGGNPDLAAEKADTYTAGLVFSPRFLPRLNLSIDYFDINVDGAISQLGGGLQNVLNLCYFVVQNADSVYCRAVPRASTTGEVLESKPARVLNGNTGGIHTRGVDLALRYRVPLGFIFPGMGEESTLDLRTNYTYLIEYTSTPVQDLPEIFNSCAGSVGSSCGDPKPRFRGSSRATLNLDTFSLSLRHRYLGPVTDDRYIVPLRRGATPPDLSTLTYPRIKAQNYFDLTAEIRATDQFSLYGGVNNITNRLPITTAGIGTYDPLGTEVFLGANFKF